MRPALILLVATLSVMPRNVSAQAVVTGPEAGARSSYRTTTVSWNPIPGATSYHLEIDDDPNFGSPEVDVTVAGTTYAMSGERLKLYGRNSGAAYVRINGMRWNSGGFTATYLHRGSDAALAVDSQNRVYLTYEDFAGPVQVVTSADWSSPTRVSLADTFNVYGLNIAVDENDVAHAAWMDQREFVRWVPFYANSSTGWQPTVLPDPESESFLGGCSEGSIVAGGGQIDLFYEDCYANIHRWTTSDGVQFTRTTIPQNPLATSVNAARDGAGNIYVASENYAAPLEDLHSGLQISGDNWNPHRLGPGRFPSIAVTPGGEVHAIRWGEDAELDENSLLPFFYSNSLRDFETWTKLPAVGSSYFEQDLLPLVLDDTRSQVHAAFPSGDGIQLCSAPHTGQAADTGFSWTCRKVGELSASRPDLALGPDGTLHVAWTGFSALGYANSLGSFLATNFPPRVDFGTETSTSSAVVLPASVVDVDGDDVSGEIYVGGLERVISRLGPWSVVPILFGLQSLQTNDNTYLSGGALQFRPMGSAGAWDTKLLRSQVPSLPAMIEVRHSTFNTVGAFLILAWNDEGIAIVQNKLVPQVTRTYTGNLPSTVDISAVPAGDAAVVVLTSDGSNPGLGIHGFTKSPGQTSLVLRP